MIETTTIYAQQLVDRLYNLQSSIAWDTTNENKEKASLFNDELGADVELYWHELAKQCAIFTVDEMLKELKSIRINLSPGSYVSYQDYKRDFDGIQHDAISKLLFLDQVKKEIEKL